MKKLHISFIHNIRNIEFIAFYGYITDYFDKRKFDDLMLQSLSNRVKAHEDDVLNLNGVVLKHELTKKIREQTRIRTDYLISLRLEIEAKTRSYLPEMRVAAERLYQWIDNFKTNLYVQSIVTQKALFEGLLFDREIHADVIAATALLNLDGLIDAIEKLTRQIDLNNKNRSTDKNSKKKGRNIRSAVYNDLRTFVDYIEFQLRIAPGDKKETEYYDIALDLNEILKRQHKLVKTRSTKRKNTKASSISLKQLVNNEQETNPLTTCQQDPSSCPLPIVLTEPLDTLILTDKTSVTPPKSSGKHKKTKNNLIRIDEK